MRNSHCSKTICFFQISLVHEEKRTQSNLGSWTSWFSNNSLLDHVVHGANVSVSNQTLVSVPYPTTLSVDTCMISHMSLGRHGRFSIRTNRFLNSFPERIKFKNRGSTISFKGTLVGLQDKLFGNETSKARRVRDGHGRHNKEQTLSI